MLHARGFPDEQMPQRLVPRLVESSEDHYEYDTGTSSIPSCSSINPAPDALLYYLISAIVTGNDAISGGILVTDYKSGSSNTWGNLANLPEHDPPFSQWYDQIDRSLRRWR